jgi:hypothetical protein
MVSWSLGILRLTECIAPIRVAARPAGINGLNARHGFARWVRNLAMRIAPRSGVEKQLLVSMGHDVTGVVTESPQY